MSTLTRVLLVSVLSLICAERVATSGELAVVRLIINGNDAGDAHVEINPPDIWVRASVLTVSGLTWTTAAERFIGTERYVLLQSLQPAVTFRFDENTVTLHVTAPPEAFAAKNSVRLTSRPSSIERMRGTSTFLNYAVGVDDSGNRRYAGELGVSLGTMLLQASVSGMDNRHLFRGPVALIFDAERRLMRWRVGDGFAGANLRGGVLPIGGLSVSREYSIDPYFVRYSPLTLTGASATPATAEIYVNGQLVGRRRVTPGSFELQDLPTPVGASDARVVIRDDFGRVQEIGSRFYRAPSVLADGLHEFRYAVGAIRRDEAETHWSYDRVVGAAEHRVGLTNQLTVGGRFEAANDYVGAGPVLAVSLPFGELALEGAFSRYLGVIGRGGMASYSYRARRLNGGISARYLSSDLVDLPRRMALDTSEPIHRDLTGWIGVSATRRLSLGIQGAHGETWTGDKTTNVGLSASLTLMSAALSANVIRTELRDRRGTEGTLLITIPLGARSSMSAGYTRSSEGESGIAFAAQRSLPYGPGWGYQLQWRDQDASISSGAFETQTSFGQARVQHDRWRSQQETNVSFAGAIVAAGGGLYATRPITDAFALVRVPGMPGVRAYASNQYVGRTNRNGDLIVPSLVSYYGNRLSLMPDGLPLEVSLLREEVLVAPSLRGGAIVEFPSAIVYPITGRFEVTVDASPQSPAFGHARITWIGGEAESPLGANGEFYFEGLPPGRHTAHVEFLGRAYVCDVRVPTVREPLDIGLVRCVSVLVASPQSQ